MNLEKILKFLEKETEKTIEYKGSNLYICCYHSTIGNLNLNMYLNGKGFQELSLDINISRFPKVAKKMSNMKLKDFFDYKKFKELKIYAESELLKRIYKFKLKRTKEKTITEKKIDRLDEYLDCIKFKKEKEKIRVEKLSNIKKELIVNILTKNIRIQDVLAEESKKILTYLIEKNIDIKKNRKQDNNQAINNMSIVKEIYNKKLSNEKELFEYLEEINYKHIKEAVRNYIITIFYFKTEEYKRISYNENQLLLLRHWNDKKRGNKNYLKCFILKELYEDKNNLIAIINEEKMNDILEIFFNAIKEIYLEKNNMEYRENKEKMDYIIPTLIGNNYINYFENIDLDNFILEIEEINKNLKNIEDCNYLYEMCNIKKELQNF